MYGGEVDGYWTGVGAKPSFSMLQCSPGKDQGHREGEEGEREDGDGGGDDDVGKAMIRGRGKGRGVKM